MARGQRDFGQYAAKSTVGGMSDAGEMAARLGSIVTFDRRGDVVFLDSFESGLSKWETGAAGLGAAVSQSAEAARSGGFSAKLVCGSNGLAQANINKYLPFPVLSCVGLEFSFTVEEHLETLDLQLALYNGTTLVYGRVRYDEDNKLLKYLDSAAAWRTLEAAYQLMPSIYIFHTLKLVVDFETSKYKRLLIDNNSWDMSAIAAYSTPSATLPVEFASIVADGAGGENATIYVDDVINTQNEP